MKSAIIRIVLALTIVFSMVGGIWGAKSISAAPEENWLAGWANRVQLTIDHTIVPSSLSNFPVLLNLCTRSGINKTDLSGVFNTLGSDSNRKKIAVTTADGLTECYVEIEEWNTASKQAILWVKVPSISSSTDTKLYLYYDPAHTDNTSMIGDKGSGVAENVWDNNFVGVYHFSEQGNGTVGEIKDSTSKKHNGQAMSDAGKAKPVCVDTPLGFGQAFNGGANNNYYAKNYIRVPDHDDFSIVTTNKFTYSFWYNPNVTLRWPDNNTGGDYVHTIGKGRSGGSWEWDFGLGLDGGSNNKYLGIMSYQFNRSGGLGDGVGIGGYVSSPYHQLYEVGDWLYVVGFFDNNARSMGLHVFYCDENRNLIKSYYRNNVGWRYLNSPGNTSEALYIGSVPNQYFDGIIDEFRCSNIVRSQAWNTTSFYSETDKLIRYGTPERRGTSPSLTPTTPTPTPGGTTFGINSGNYTYNQHAAAVQAMRFLNTAGTGTLSKLELLIDDTTPNGKVRLGVYSDNNGRPGVLLLDAGETTVTNGWVSVSGSSLPVTANRYYWLAYSLQSANGVRCQSGQAVRSHYWADGVTSYGRLPSIYPSDSRTGSNSNQFVMRATVSSTSSGTVTGTFGLDAGNSNWNQTGGTLDVQRFKNTAGTGILRKLEMLINDTTPTGKVRLGVYSDNNGRPGVRLLDAGETTVTNGWVSISGLNLPVTANRYYWLAFELQSPNTARYQSGQASGSHYWVKCSYGPLPGYYPTSGITTNSSPYVMRALVEVN